MDHGIKNGHIHGQSSRLAKAHVVVIAAWKTTISVLVAKGRARVGVAASVADWPKRIRDLQFLDHEGYSAAT